MPLLEIAPTKKVVATITLEETTALNVDRYAAFVNANADDVVSQALSYVFTRDKDFQKFLEAPDNRKAPTALRIRDNKMKRGRKPAAKAQHHLTRAALSQLEAKDRARPSTQITRARPLRLNSIFNVSV